MSSDPFKQSFGFTSSAAVDFEHLSSLCRHGKANEVESLLSALDSSVPIDHRDDAGNNLLHIAAQNNSKRLAKLCLRKGADINARNARGQTALHFAFAFGYEELGRYLISKGADDSMRNSDGLTCYEGLERQSLDYL